VEKLFNLPKVIQLWEEAAKMILLCSFTDSTERGILPKMDHIRVLPSYKADDEIWAFLKVIYR
jgi:hypothetical protein